MVHDDAIVILATPLVSIMKVVFSKTEMGKPVAELMAGRLPNGSIVDS